MKPIKLTLEQAFQAEAMKRDLVSLSPEELRHLCAQLIDCYMLQKATISSLVKQIMDTDMPKPFMK